MYSSSHCREENHSLNSTLKNVIESAEKDVSTRGTGAGSTTRQPHWKIRKCDESCCKCGMPCHTSRFSKTYDGLVCHDCEIDLDAL